MGYGDYFRCDKCSEITHNDDESIGCNRCHSIICEECNEHDLTGEPYEQKEDVKGKSYIVDCPICKSHTREQEKDIELYNFINGLKLSLKNKKELFRLIEK